MSLKFAAITPHPPIIVPGVGSRADLAKCQNTTDAMKKLAMNFAATSTQTILIISPHSPVAPSAFAVNASPSLESSLLDFGAAEPHYTLDTDSELASEIISQAKPDLPVTPIESPILDHGVNVPLHFLLAKKPVVKLVSMSFCGLSLSKHYDFGKYLAKIISDLKKEIAVIASGDLSHRLTPEAPAGFSPRGSEFDEKIVAAVKAGDTKSILGIDAQLVNDAGECGLRSIAILLGILGEQARSAKVLSYEGPFGVGYLVADYKLN